MALRNILLTALALAIALGGGLWLTRSAIDRISPFDAVTIAGWTAYPLSGTPEADPYAKARLARDATLALGAAEGVTFYADRDDSGAALDSACTYRIHGKSPASRLWTLYPVSPLKDRFAAARPMLPQALSARSIFYNDDGTFDITAAANAQPNNWLALPAGQRFTLALTLYDSPVATNKGLVETAFPAVTQEGCNG